VALDQVAKCQCKPSQVALMWLVGPPGVGAHRQRHVLAQLRELVAATRLELDAEAIRTLDAASAPA
jgi:aryl-alcohol dehydrogenase-like predicted oxidoreductase